MTERERVLAVLKHEKPDRLPWLADFDYLISSWKTDGIYPAKYENRYGDEGLQRMHRDFGAGFYLQGYEPFTAVRSGVDIQTQKCGDVTVTTWNTPVGSLREVTQFSKASYSSGITEHLIKDIEDLKVYAWICAHTHYEPNYELAQMRYKSIGDNGVVLCYTPKSPLMALVALLAGVENVTYMKMDDEEEFAALLDEIEDCYDEACRLAVESPAECIMIPENISSECVASFYQDHMNMLTYHGRHWQQDWQ